MSHRRLKEGDLVILSNLPSNWKRPGERYAGMLYERFDMHKGSRTVNSTPYPSWCWRIKWFSDIPPCYDYENGMGEVNLLNMTSIKTGTHIPIGENNSNAHTRSCNEISA